MTLRNPTLAHGYNEEVILRVETLPLTLNIDQDAIVFLLKFFNFEPTPMSSDFEEVGLDGEISPQEPFQGVPGSDGSENPQRETTGAPGVYFKLCQIHAVSARIDYEPKNCDYSKLFFGGDLSELAGVIPLRHAMLRLSEVSVRGVSGVDALITSVWNEWMRDCIRIHGPAVLAGVAGMRPLTSMMSATAGMVREPLNQYPRFVGGLLDGVGLGARTTAVEMYVVLSMLPVFDPISHMMPTKVLLYQHALS